MLNKLHRGLYIFLILCCCISLTACSFSQQSAEDIIAAHKKPTEENQFLLGDITDDVVVEIEGVEEVEEEEVVQVEIPAMQETPYIIDLSGDTPIYEEPRFDSAFVQYVELSGPYTIVEEAYDEEYNLWGKLKSGVGWVFLQKIAYVITSTTIDSDGFIYLNPDSYNLISTEDLESIAGTIYLPADSIASVILVPQDPDAS